MSEDTPENRAKAEGFLGPLVQVLGKPVSIATFGGRLEFARLPVPWFWRKMAKSDKSGQMREGDWRDWEAIRLWAHHLPEALEVS